MSMGEAYWNGILRSSTQDPQGAIMQFLENNRSMFIGISGSGPDPNLPVFTFPSTHMLAMGTPRAANKTTATMIPALCLHRGPAVVISTKLDLYTETALLRSRLGKIWFYNPDPSLHYFREINLPYPPVGTTAVRWNPTSGCEDESIAEYRAKRTVEIGNINGSGAKKLAGENKFWDVNAKDLIAALFHWAAVARRPLDDVIRVVTRQELVRKRANVERDGIPGLGDIEAFLRAQNTWEGTKFSDTLFGLLNAEDGETTSNVLATTRVSLSPWYNKRTIDSTKRPNFKITEFVTGRPDDYSNIVTDFGRMAGQSDTLYIIVPERAQERLAPMVLSLVMAIRDATHEKFDIDTTLRAKTVRPMLFAFDEMFHLGAIPDLVSLLSEGGSQNVLLCGALQSYHMARAKWGLEEGNAMRQLFGHQLLAPGMLDEDTRVFSAAAGEAQQPTVSYGESWGGLWNLQVRWMKQIGWEWRPKLPPSHLYAGPGGESVWHFWSKGGWASTQPLPYFKGFMLEIFMRSIHHALADPERAQLPLPALNRDGDFHFIGNYGGRSWVDWWSRMESYHSQRAIGGPS